MRLDIAMTGAALTALLVSWATPSVAEPGVLSDAALIEGFNLTVFGSEAEDDVAARAGSARVKKFTGPVDYRIVAHDGAGGVEAVRLFVEELGESIQNLTLNPTDAIEDAELVIHLTRRADYARVIEETVWHGIETGFMTGNACSAVIAARRSGIERALIYLVADEGFLTLSHCMVEEIAQALGPANDSPRLAASIFNDESPLSVLGAFDWFILNMLYDPRVRPGMSEADVAPLLPSVIASVRPRLSLALGRDGALANEVTAGR